MSRLALRQFFPETEPEIRILNFLVSAGDTAIDVGANIGSYVSPLLKMGCNVIAIEPNPAIARELELMYGAKIRVIRAAASNHLGKATMRAPAETVLGGLGTIEPENTLLPGDSRAFEVDSITIDSLGLARVDLIKVDVEGHELSVLQGAEKVLRTQRPRLIVEAEDRHRPGATASVFEYLRGLNYEGFMLADGRLAPIRAFDLAVHQKVDAISVDDLNHRRISTGYVNNFVFVPA